MSPEWTGELARPYPQVEGASIDEQDHPENPCGQIGEAVARSHTGTQVRIAAQGPQAANVVGVSHQTDLLRTMARALGLAT